MLPVIAYLLRAPRMSHLLVQLQGILRKCHHVHHYRSEVHLVKQVYRFLIIAEVNSEVVADPVGW